MGTNTFCVVDRRKMDKVYLLQHSYEVVYEGESFDETKIIGIYTTKENAEEVVRRYKSIVGFDKYPLSCFNIDVYELNQDHWKEGFVKSDEIAEDFENLTYCFNKWLNFEKTIEESWEDDEYYDVLCEVNREAYKAKDAVELAIHISRIWSLHFNKNPKTVEECIDVATKVLQSLKLRG